MRMKDRCPNAKEQDVTMRDTQLEPRSIVCYRVIKQILKTQIIINIKPKPGEGEAETTYHDGAIPRKNEPNPKQSLAQRIING